MIKNIHNHNTKVSPIHDIKIVINRSKVYIHLHLYAISSHIYMICHHIIIINGQNKYFTCSPKYGIIDQNNHKWTTNKRDLHRCTNSK
jgi:hypothetical protein